MNREEFQKELSNRFQNTESGFGNMTQRELILLQIASNMYESEVKKFRLGAVMGSILKGLEERKQWAENGMMVYSDDTGMRMEYQARIEEIENAIWVVSQHCP